MAKIFQPKKMSIIIAFLGNGLGNWVQLDLYLVDVA